MENCHGTGKISESEKLLVISITVFNCIFSFVNLFHGRFLHPDSYKLLIERNFEGPLFHCIYNIPTHWLGNEHHVYLYLSAVFGSLNVILTYILGRHLFCRTVGLYSAMFLSMFGIHYFYCRTALPYALQTTLILISFIGFLKGLEGSRIRRWFIVGSGIFSGLAFLVYVPSYAAILSFLTLVIFSGNWRKIRIDALVFLISIIFVLGIMECLFRFDGDSYFVGLIQYYQRTTYFVRGYDLFSLLDFFGKIYLYGGAIPYAFILFSVIYVSIKGLRHKGVGLRIPVGFFYLSYGILTVTFLLKIHPLSSRHFIFLTPVLCVFLGIFWMDLIRSQKRYVQLAFLGSYFFLALFSLTHLNGVILKIKPIQAWMDKHGIEEGSVLTFLDLEDKAYPSKTSHFIPGHFIEGVSGYTIDWRSLRKLYDNEMVKYILVSGIGEQSCVGVHDNILKDIDPVMSWMHPLKRFDGNGSYIQDFQLYSLAEIFPNEVLYD